MAEHKTLKHNWLGYSGSKWKLSNEVMDFIPDDVETFVDLFGGTGIVSATAWINGKIKKAVFNEFEWDMAECLAMMADNEPEEVIKYYKAAQSFWFGDATRIDENMIGRWKELEEFFNVHKPRFDEDERHHEIRRKYREQKEPLVGMKIVTGSELHYIDNRNNPWILLMLLARNAYRGTLNFEDNGTRFRKNPQTGIIKNPENIREFLEIWHDMATHDALEIYSHNFLDLHIKGYQHQRKRPTGNEYQKNNLKLNEEDRGKKTSFGIQEHFNELIEKLTPQDFIFIDPPYRGSKEDYNKSYTPSSEIQLLALLELLNERGIPYLLTNNLSYGNSLLTTWLDIERYRTKSPKKHVWLMDKGYRNKTGIEVFVTNQKKVNKKKLSETLVYVPKTEQVLEFADREFG